ncbi:MAG: biotin/lipoyl-binding protein, partial [Lautropia sp.]
MNRGVLGGLAALAIAAAASGGYWYGAKKTSAPVAKATGAPAPGAPAAPRPIAVEVAVVATLRLPQTITAVGSLRSDESVTLRPEVAGRITEILFKEGRPVSRGDPLVRLDPSVSQAE